VLEINGLKCTLELCTCPSYHTAEHRTILECQRQTVWPQQYCRWLETVQFVSALADLPIYRSSQISQITHVHLWEHNKCASSTQSRVRTDIQMLFSRTCKDQIPGFSKTQKSFQDFPENVPFKTLVARGQKCINKIGYRCICIKVKKWKC